MTAIQIYGHTSVLLSSTWNEKRFGQNCRENQNILFTVTFFWEISTLWDNVEKNCRAGQATNDKVAHTHYMLDN